MGRLPLVQGHTLGFRMFLYVNASVLAVPFTWGNACKSFLVIEPCKHEALVLVSLDFWLRPVQPVAFREPRKGQEWKPKGPMASLKIPPRLFWFPLWGTSRYYLLPNREFVSQKLQDVGGLKKKTKSAASTTTKTAAAWTQRVWILNKGQGETRK